MSARELRSLRGSQTSPPERGRKRLRSNADEATTKRLKATGDDEEDGSIESVKKVATKGKGKNSKGKTTRFVMHPFIQTYELTITTSFGRITAAQRAAKDNIEDAKGAPVSLTPYVFFYCSVLLFSFFPYRSVI
jgi:hypothetical protein